MRKLSWAVTAYNFGPSQESYKLKVEEAEDSLSMAVEMMKAVKRIENPDLSQDHVDDIMQEMLSALDKIRIMRTNMKMNT